MTTTTYEATTGRGLRVQIDSASGRVDADAARAHCATLLATLPTTARQVAAVCRGRTLAVAVQAAAPVDARDLHQRRYAELRAAKAARVEAHGDACFGVCCLGQSKVAR